MKKVRNQDIASALGISAAAVSMARNYKPGVSEETRERVFEYIRQQEDAAASQGGNHFPARKKTIALCIHKNSNGIIIEKPFFSDLMETIQREADERGFNIVIKYSNADTDLNRFVAQINEDQIFGVIILATEMSEKEMAAYDALKCKCVLLDAYFDGFNRWDSVTIDNFNATFHAFEYAYKKGHRRFGYIRCANKSQNFDHRFEGFQKGLRVKGLTLEEGSVFTLRSNVLDAYIDMNQVLCELPEGYQFPTCLLADLDYMAIGAFKALEEHGYKVPEDVSIIGFDDIDFGDVYGVQLTTVHLHQKTMGKVAVQLLTDPAMNEKPCTLHIEVSGDLIERGSVRELPNMR